MYYTRIACRLLDLKTCQCSDYPNRRASVPDCIQLNAGTPHSSSGFRPPAPTAGGRAQDLPLWHHLVCGDREAVHVERISQAGRMLAEGSVAEALGRPPDFPCWLNLAPIASSQDQHTPRVIRSVEFSSMLARLLSLFALVLFIVGPAQAAKRVDLDYHVRFLPAEDQAVVQLIYGEGRGGPQPAVQHGRRGLLQRLRADGEWQQESPALGTGDLPRQGDPPAIAFASAIPVTTGASMRG